MFRHACKLGLEGIVSKRKDSAYRSGRSPDWLKMKNANAPAVKREEEEEWGRGPWSLSPYLQQSVMAKKNLSGCLGRFSPRQIELTIIALVAYLDLPPERLKCVTLIGLSSPQVLKRALINALYKGLLTFKEAQEIASIIGVSLYNR